MKNESNQSTEGKRRILYCRCAFAKVVPTDVKDDVLKALSSSGVAFDAVSDLCDLAARNDPSLGRIAGSNRMKIAACYPRAVKWLFHAAQTPLGDGVEILNMREESAAAVVASLLENGSSKEDDS